MRPIDADRLLSDRMRKMYYHLPNGDTAVPIIDIENAPTIGGWISVKENLPKVSGHYLVSCVTNKTGHRWEVPVNAEWLTSRREWYIETENCLASTAGVTVTHYMPLPEQPKENEDE